MGATHDATTPCTMHRLQRYTILYFVATFLAVCLVHLIHVHHENTTARSLQQNLTPLQQNCVCNASTLPHLLPTATTLECIGPGGNTRPLPDKGWGNAPKCFRVYENFLKALAQEDVPIVPQFGTFLRWYRDCEFASREDHDIDLGLFAQDWNSIDWARVFRRTAWLHLMQGDLDAAFWWFTDFIEWHHVHYTTIAQIKSPTKFYINNMGGVPECAIDVWLMYHHMDSNINWRCLSDWGITYSYGPVDTYQKIVMNGIPGAYAPTNTEHCVEQTFGPRWHEKIGVKNWYALEKESTHISIHQESNCASLVHAFDGRTYKHDPPCTCYNDSELHGVSRNRAFVRKLLVWLWLFVPCGGLVFAAIAMSCRWVRRAIVGQRRCVPVVQMGCLKDGKSLAVLHNEENAGYKQV